LHGIKAEREWIMDTANTVTAKLILDTQNVEVRRTLLKLKGFPAFLREAKARPMDSWIDGGKRPCALYRIPMQDDEDLCLYEVECPSTGHKTFLRVSPNASSCLQAAAELALMRVDDYRPEVET
jgi:hypothetical protein